MDESITLTYSDQSASGHRAHSLVETSLKTILDDLSEGVLVVDGAGQRVYSNPALNEMVGGNACLPLGTPEPPPYVPADQRHRYLLALKGTSSLLTLEGSGTTSTWFELLVPGRGRFRARVTISAFTGPRGWRFAVWLLSAPNHQQAVQAQDGGTGDGTGAAPADGQPAGWPGPGPMEMLTRREKDVLQLLLDGRRVSSIARSLYLSPQTVRNHLKAIFRKFGAHSQAELLDNLRPALPAALPAQAGYTPSRRPPSGN